MNQKRGFVISGLLIAVGIGLIATLSRGDNSVPSSTTNSEPIPVIVEPGDGDMSGSNDSGATLQQPGRFSGQIDGADGLQDAATLSPEEFNHLDLDK